MARYIDAGKLKEYLHEEDFNTPDERWRPESEFASMIDATPTADVAEVVRCKECKHATFYSCKNDACYKAIICEYKIGIGDENFYCACAEPRTPKERSDG